jgi:predicted DNA-binding protein with PD1-like motif
MMSRLLHAASGQRTFVVVFETGDEVMQGLQTFVREQQLSGSHFTAIGAFEKVTLGYFNWEKKDYLRIPVNEQVEVVALIGDIASDPKGQPKVHAHVVVGKFDGSAMGGHLLEATVRPTLELVLTESPTHLQRQHDPQSGLALIRP